MPIPPEWRSAPVLSELAVRYDVRTHAHTCAHMHTHAHTCAHMRTHVHTCTRMRTHAYTCIHNAYTCTIGYGVRSRAATDPACACIRPSVCMHTSHRSATIDTARFSHFARFTHFTHFTRFARFARFTHFTRFTRPTPHCPLPTYGGQVKDVDKRMINRQRLRRLGPLMLSVLWRNVENSRKKRYCILKGYHDLYKRCMALWVAYVLLDRGQVLITHHPHPTPHTPHPTPHTPCPMPHALNSKP